MLKKFFDDWKSNLKEKRLYEELFYTFQNSQWSNEELMVSSYQVGNKYSHGPLFIGREQMGWTSFRPSESNCEEFIDNARSYYDITSHIENNCYYKLWLYAEKIYYKLYDESYDNFKNNIAYTNLCKISPLAGTPNDEFYEIQLNTCREILLHEIREIDPEYIIFMTGRKWAEWFFEDWDVVNYDLTPNNPIKISGYIDYHNFIVIHNPMKKNKNERNKVIKAIENFYKVDDGLFDDEEEEDNEDNDSNNYELSEDTIQNISDVILQYAPEKWESVELEVYFNDDAFDFKCKATDIFKKHYGINIDDEDQNQLRNILYDTMIEQSLSSFNFVLDFEGNYNIIF